MSAFEFISVSVAIVLALTLGKLMSAVNDVFDKARRDYLHIGFYLLSYIGILTMWWSQWMMVRVETWTFFAFVLVMASPIGLYFTVHSLLSSNPSETESWRGYFERNHRWFFSAMLFTTIAVFLRRFFVADESSQLLLLLFGLRAIVIGWAIASTSRAVHATALATWAVILSYAIAVQFAIER